MLSFSEILKIEQLIEKWLPEAQELYKDIISVTATTAAGTLPTAILPSKLQFGRRLVSGLLKRHLVVELSSTGKMTESEAQAMVTAGETPAPVTGFMSGTPGAAGTLFANILTWLTTNGPTIAADIAAAIPVIIKLITLFSAL